MNPYIHKWPYLSEIKCMYGNTCYIYGSFLIINTYTFAMKHHCFCEIHNVMKILGSQITTKWFDYISHDLKHIKCPEFQLFHEWIKWQGGTSRYQWSSFEEERSGCSTFVLPGFTNICVNSEIFYLRTSFFWLNECIVISVQHV